MMKNPFVLFTALLLFSSICFAVPSQPTDRSSFSTSVPSQYTPPEPTYITTNIQTPIPTNKFFNSVIKNPTYNNKYSVDMYTYPQVVRAEGTGLLIEFPEVKHSTVEYPEIGYSADRMTFKDNDYDHDADEHANTIAVSISTTVSNGYSITFPSAKLDGYSDFAATIKWEKEDNEDNYWMKSTIVQGSPFSYYEFCEGVYPSLGFPYEWGNFWDGSTPGYTLYDAATGEQVEESALEYAADAVILHVHLETKDLYYGIFVPQGTKFVQDSNNLRGGTNYFPWVRTVIDFSGDERYMSIALLPSASLEEAVEDVSDYYKYAYNFVTDTKVSWEVSSSDYSSKTTFNITTTKKRTVEGQRDGTIFCLYPHQYNNASSVDYLNNKTFNTLRGKLKLAKGSGFSTKVGFKGIIPFFQYDVEDIKEDLSFYLKNDANEIKVDTNPYYDNPYRAGKIIAKLANLLPIADNLKDDPEGASIKTSITVKLKSLLKNWLTFSAGENARYFAYDDTWGGLEGIKDDVFYSFRYNDHHFHFGYFIYSAAILAMYDADFANEYGQMVNFLIKDIANTKRNDPDFPFMRHFDFYESHSWANGMGGQDNGGIDQESSSEAMNAWSAIYLWGLATGNKEYENLGIYLYSNEYEAIKYYYFDIDGEIFPSEYGHNSVGRLFGGLFSYDLFFYPMIPQTIKGIQVLPMTPAMTYLAYDGYYLDDFYDQSLTESGANEQQWYDIWARLISLRDPQEAISKFDAYKQTEPEEGSSMSFTYHFINFFDKYGTPVFTHSADTSSYMVLEKDGINTYCAYNPGNSSKNVTFYSPSGELLGYLHVPKKSFAMTQDLSKDVPSEKIMVYPVPYKPNSGGRYGGDGIHFSNVDEGTNIQIFNIAGEKVFETTVDSSDDFLWKAKNNAGNDIASGVYFYYIKTSEGTKVKGKLAIER
ncbi:MAG: gliding motility-associated C-terminal domain-containing protein [Elusimicrobia bacterium]|nr:gliding motility-associated C-terminal domain-containing protein [Elusimicrobiota bacterium]